METYEIITCNKNSSGKSYMILVSIWYASSCANLSHSNVKKVKTLIRNFVWSCQVDGKARAKVAWDIIILPLARRGL